MSEESDGPDHCVNAIDCPPGWFCSEEGWCVESLDAPPADKDFVSDQTLDGDTTGTESDIPVESDIRTDGDIVTDHDIDVDADHDVDVVSDKDGNDSILPGDSDELLPDTDGLMEDDDEAPEGTDHPPVDDAPPVDDTVITDVDLVPTSCGDGQNASVDGLVLYFRMDEPVLFSTTYDSSPNALNGKFSAGASLGNTGARGGALAFNQDSNLQVADTALLDLSGPMTVMGWVYLDPHGDNVWPYPVVIKGNGRQANYYVWREADRKLNFGFHQWELTGTGCGAKSTIDIDDSAWHYFAGTYDGTYVRLYVYNSTGTLEDQITSDPCTQTPLPNDRAFTVGQIPPNTEYPKHYYYSTGYLDELRVYSRALTEGEILLIKDGTHEYCDDGDAEDSDGCSGACQVEAGHICYGSPSTCIPTPSWQCTHSINICDSTYDYYDSSYSEYYYRSWVGTSLQAVSESSILWTSPSFTTYQWVEYTPGATCWGTWYNYTFTSGKTVDLNYAAKGAYDPNQCYFQLKSAASGGGSVITTTAATGSGEWPANYSYTGTCLQP